MREYSKISPRLWLDANFRSLADDARMAFIWALTCPAQNSAGAFRGSPLTFAAETGWSPERAQMAFQQVSENRMLEFDPAANLVAVPRFLKYNMPNSPGACKALGRLLGELPECPLRSAHIERVCCEIRRLSKAMRTAFLDGIPDGTLDGIPDGFEETPGKHPRSKEQRTKNKEDEPIGSSPPDGEPLPSLTEFLSIWNEHANRHGWCAATAMTATRSKAFRTRLKDPAWRASWRRALEQAGQSPFLRGENDRGWKMDLDFFLRPDSVAKIIEGKYGNGPVANTQGERGASALDDPEIAAWAALQKGGAA